MLQSKSCSSLKISSANFNPSKLITVSDKRNKFDTVQYTTVFTQLSIFLSYDKVFYAALEVLSHHFRGGIEEDHDKNS
jgi:hypothetical protein